VETERECVQVKEDVLKANEWRRRRSNIRATTTQGLAMLLARTFSGEEVAGAHATGPPSLCFLHAGLKN